MFGMLPRELEVNGTSYAIRTDFRDCMLILTMFNDEELTIEEKYESMLRILYYDRESIPQEDTIEAIEQAIYFLDVGKEAEEGEINTTKVIDWEQDEQLIFSAMNKVANKELRECDYLHYWSFIGYFHEVGEGLLSTVVSIRIKQSKGKKLEKHEQEFYLKNRAMCDLQNKYSADIKAEIDKINSIFT